MTIVQERSRRGKSGVRFGDEDFQLEQTDDLLEVYDKASCKEVFEACCVHTGSEWLGTALSLAVLLFSFYWMVFGLNLLGDAAKVMTGCAAGKRFGSDHNPLTSMITGMFSTILMQSSGTTTGVVVSLTEASVISVDTGIYMVMGANVGTTVTAVLVSISQMGGKDKLERSFSAAAIHGLFNFYTIGVLFPVELATGFLNKLTATIAKGAETGRTRDSYEGPVKRYVTPLSNLLLMSNKGLINEIAEGEKTCQDFYPVSCDEGTEPSYGTCVPGLVGCNKSTGECPAFFRASASAADDKMAGLVCFILSVFLLMFSLLGIVWALNRLLFGMSPRVVHALTSCNGYVEFLVGIGITIVTQSSSITTSILVPFAGVGALRLEQIYPLVVGANIGTALNGVISALDKAGTDPLQVALVHLFINLIGFLIWYPLPPLRGIPFFVARNLGANAKRWKWFPTFYFLIVYITLPLLLLAIGSLYGAESKGAFAGAVTLSVILATAVLGTWFWCRCMGGRERYHKFLKEKCFGSSTDEDTDA